MDIKTIQMTKHIAQMKHLIASFKMRKNVFQMSKTIKLKF